MNYEVTMEKSFARRLNIELTAHCCKGNNMIETVDMKNVNTGSLTNKGIEIAVDNQPARCLNVRASYSYLHSSLSDLTGAPKNRYSFCAAWQALPPREDAVCDCDDPYAMKFT